MVDILNMRLKDKDAFLPCGNLQPALLESAAAPLSTCVAYQPQTLLPFCYEKHHDLNHHWYHQVHAAWSWQHLQQPFQMVHAACKVSKADACPLRLPTS